MWAATTIAKEFLSFFNLIWNFFYFWDEICHACLSLSFTVLDFLSKYVQSQMHQLLSWRFSFPGLYNTHQFQAVIFSCFGLRRTKRREVYLSLFEKKKNLPNKHTLFSWIRLLCVAEIRFFFELVIRVRTVTSFGWLMSRDNNSLQRVEGSFSKICKFERLLQINHQFLLFELLRSSFVVCSNVYPLQQCGLSVLTARVQR